MSNGLFGLALLQVKEKLSVSDETGWFNVLSLPAKNHGKDGMQDFDIVVAGGNMVGAALALGLTRLGYKVAVLEPHMPVPFDRLQQPDIRVSAISLASQRLLEQLEAWPYIQGMRVCPYRRLSVWEEQGRTDFSATELDVPHLGHIIENRIVQLGLHQAMADKTVVWFEQALLSVRQDTKHVQLTLTDQTVLQCRLLIGADGAASKVRTQAGIATHGWQYAQQALAVSVKTHSPMQDITWQQFTPSGPMAFLPLFDGYASLVWYHSADEVKRLKRLPFEQLKTQICQSFPDELVDFSVMETASFSLTRMHANHYYQGRMVLAGDAAHTINPLAGQGVNLGFKDVACLLELLGDKQWLDDSSKLDGLLGRYQRKRYKDNLLMMTAMDGLYATFSNALPPVRLLRNLGLGLAQRAGPLKKQVTRYAMGL